MIFLVLFNWCKITNNNRFEIKKAYDFYHMLFQFIEVLNLSKT